MFEKGGGKGGGRGIKYSRENLEPGTDKIEILKPKGKPGETTIS